jgi:hypothetical protein
VNAYRRTTSCMAALVMLNLLACGTTVPAATSAGPGDSLGPAYPRDEADDGLGSSKPGGEPLAGADSAGADGAGTANSTSLGPTKAGESIPSGPRGSTVAPTAMPPTQTAADVPATGPGWDRQFVYVGVVTNQDISTAAGRVGADSLDSGDQKAAAESMIAETNAQGGLFGRMIKGIFFDVSTLGNREAKGQATCTHFTQDNRVVAVFNAAGVNDTDSFRACMSKARTMVFSTSLAPLDDQTLSREQGWYVATLSANWSRYAPALVQRLSAQKYFDGWDTAAGAPGKQAVKIGVIAADTPQSRRTADLLSRSLARVGHAPAARYLYRDTQDQQAAVLRFRSDGITHVFSLDNVLFLFMQNAESQGYRPRYAINSLNLPSLLLSGTAPVRQLVGALGLGWMPNVDVDASHEPADALIPGRSTCNAVMQKRGPRYPPNKRFAILYFYVYCDMFRILAKAATDGGLGPEQLRAAVTRASSVHPAATFRNGLSPQQAAVPAGAVDIRWDPRCGCFAYSGAVLGF